MCLVHLLICNREFLVNPFLFMIATLVGDEKAENGEHQPISGAKLTGRTVSSLYRLRHVDKAREHIRTPTFLKGLIDL